MRTSSVVTILVIIIIILAAGWYWLAHSGTGTNYAPVTQSAGTGVPSQSSSSGAQTQGAYTIGSNVALGQNSNATVGAYVVGFNGMTLYTYSRDSAGNSTCYGSCAALWPPYTVTSTANLTAEAPLSGTVGTTMRTDGTTQLTYNGMPLYFYQKDTAPGQTTGQGVGGVWYVAKP